MIMVVNETMVDYLMDIPTKLCRNMSYRFISSCLKSVDPEISQHHFMILKLLQEEKQLYVTAIVEELSITKPQMTASADKLIQKGYIKRGEDTKDRRKIVLSITPKGEEISNAIRASIEVKIQNNLAQLTEDEQERLADGLGVLFKFCTI